MRRQMRSTVLQARCATTLARAERSQNLPRARAGRCIGGAGPRKPSSRSRSPSSQPSCCSGRWARGNGSRTLAGLRPRSACAHVRPCTFTRARRVANQPSPPRSVWWPTHFACASRAPGTLEHVLPRAQSPPRTGRWSETHRVEGAFGLAGIYSIAAVLLVPALLLTIIAGFILGLPVGCCAVIVGATLGACLAFVNSRFLLKSWVDENLVKRYPQLSAFNEVIRKNEFYVVFLLRLSPLVPYNALNYCLGVMPVGFVPYLFASFFGKPALPAPPARSVSRLCTRQPT
jgi:hypothetical protein